MFWENKGNSLESTPSSNRLLIRLNDWESKWKKVVEFSDDMNKQLKNILYKIDFYLNYN